MRGKQNKARFALNGAQQVLCTNPETPPPLDPLERLERLDFLDPSLQLLKQLVL